LQVGGKRAYMSRLGKDWNPSSRDAIASANGLIARSELFVNLLSSQELLLYLCDDLSFEGAATKPGAKSAAGF
jgi:hypothetical protein